LDSQRNFKVDCIDFRAGWVKIAYTSSLIRDRYWPSGILTLREWDRIDPPSQIKTRTTLLALDSEYLVVAVITDKTGQWKIGDKWTDTRP
jgi:hypothetical protein